MQIKKSLIMIKMTILIIFTILLFWLIHYKYLSIDEIDVRIADINKGVFVSMCENGIPSKYGCDEYRNEDSGWHFKFNSGKIRSRLAIAETDSEVVRVKVYGYRIELFSIRKNILSVVE